MIVPSSTLEMVSVSPDIASTVSSFLSDQYLNTAGLSRSWREAYGSLPKTTRGVDYDTTVDQFVNHLELGHGRTDTRVSKNPGVYTPPAKNDQGQKPCAVAASLGRTDLLQIAYESELAERDLTACAAAAANGHLETLKYLRFVECPWDESTANEAARGGHLDLLVWALENGCPSNDATQLHAASRGDLDMVMWLHHNNHPVHSSVLEAAVYSEAVYILVWAWNIGIVFPMTFTAAVESGNLDVVKYLSGIRHPWDEDHLTEYVQFGNPDSTMVGWLSDNGYIRL